jgi:hypothetical protein
MKFAILIAGFAALLFTPPLSPGPVDNATAGERSHVPKGVHLELTRDFYEALMEEGREEGKVYSNDPSAAHLREIAVSTRFMVETNLEIIKQQEMMIELLRRLLEK